MAEGAKSSDTISEVGQVHFVSAIQPRERLGPSSMCQMCLRNSSSGFQNAVEGSAKGLISFGDEHTCLAGLGLARHVNMKWENHTQGQGLKGRPPWPSQM